MKFSKDRFVVRIYDSLMRKGEAIDIPIPDNIKRYPTKFYSYVSIGNEILMAGG